MRELLELGGSVNLYMFHGGTNFGFMNGCSARHTHDLHQVTSYDYDAPLDEEGNPTEKWYLLRDVVRDLFPDNWTADPLVKTAVGVPAEKVELTGRAGLFENLAALDPEPVRSLYPQTMEDMGQSYGYTLYRAQVERDTTEPERIRVVDGRDRAQVFVNQQLVATQYQEHIGEDIRYALPEEHNQLDVLVENMGRVNYGHKFLADTQRKGIRTGVCVDLHFVPPRPRRRLARRLLRWLGRGDAVLLALRVHARRAGRHLYRHYGLWQGRRFCQRDERGKVLGDRTHCHALRAPWHDARRSQRARAV